MVDVEENALLRRNVFCIKKQFLCATSVKKIHWEVTELLLDYVLFSVLFWNLNCEVISKNPNYVGGITFHFMLFTVAPKSVKHWRGNDCR
jgi:hypothetical protein